MYDIKYIMEIPLKKRGRKPKSQSAPIFKGNTNTDTPIIAHLEMNYSDISDQLSDDIFIKHDTVNSSKINSCEKKPKKTKTTIDELTIKLQKSEKEQKKLQNIIDELTNKLQNYDCISKPCLEPLNNMANSKCWWCSNNYDKPTIELPEYYYNNTFYSFGNFCSYNCAMAYNINMNDDNISKRNSLLNFHYKETYNVDVIIKPAPSWKILTDFGGCIKIEDFRKNFITNEINYLYIKPPLISRISYVEKVPVVQNMQIIKPNEFVLKRSIPLNSTKYTLESTIGLKKIINLKN